MDIFSKLRNNAQADKPVVVPEPKPKKQTTAVAQVSKAPENYIDNSVTIREMKDALPSHLKSTVSQDFVDKFNRIATDVTFAETIRDSFVSYASVLMEGKFKVKNYLDAVVYVSHKLSGKTNQDAYIATFPDRYNELVSTNREKDLSAYVSQYAAGKLPNLILEQSMIPIHVLNMDVRQKAVNRLAHLMQNATSEFVQANAATALLAHLKTPDKAGGININMNIGANDGMNALHDQLAALAQKSLDILEGGAISVAELAAAPLFQKDEDAEII